KLAGSGSSIKGARPTRRVPTTAFQSRLHHTPRLRLTPSLFPEIAENESREALDEDTDGRSDWFTFQRTYPSNSFPPDARLKAWHSRPDYQLNSSVSTPAA